jgi:hypothetical protein
MYDTGGQNIKEMEEEKNFGVLIQKHLKCSK